MLLRHHLQPAGIRLELRGLPAEEHRDQQQRQQGVLPVMKDRWFDPGENALGHAHGRTPRFWTPRRPTTISCPSNSTASDSGRSEEHTSELQSLMRISYAVFCLKKKKQQTQHHN